MSPTVRRSRCCTEVGHFSKTTIQDVQRREEEEAGDLLECACGCASSGRRSCWRLCRSRDTGKDAHLKDQMIETFEINIFWSRECLPLEQEVQRCTSRGQAVVLLSNGRESALDILSISEVEAADSVPRLFLNDWLFLPFHYFVEKIWSREWMIDNFGPWNKIDSNCTTCSAKQGQTNEVNNRQKGHTRL